MNVYRSIVVTGGKGMLAHALLNALKARGHAAFAVDRDECDITQPEQVARLYKEQKPSLLINCAAHTAVDLCEDEPEKANAINGHAVGLLAQNAKEYGTTLVHISTDFVFDGQNVRPYRTDDKPNPISVYGASKFLGEKLLQDAAPDSWMILRTAWLFGRHGNCFPQTIVKLARAGRPLRIVSDQVGSPTGTVDLAAALFRLVDEKARGIFHLTNSGVTSWFEFASASLKEFGVTSDLAPVTTAEWCRMRPKQARRPAFSVLDGGRYTQVTGQTMPPWQEALAQYRASFGDNPEF